MAKLAVRRLPGAMGCEIENLDLRFLDDDHFFTIESALYEHLVVILPRQTIGPKSFLGLARRFGEPKPYPGTQFHHPIDPNILLLSNRRTEKGEPAGLTDVGTDFHTDDSHLPIPARCTLLFAQEISKGEAGTTFADQRRAYEDLPDQKKSEIDGLVACHHAANRDNLDAASRAEPPVQDCVRHPLVRVHPHTKKKSLYAVSGTSFGIEGLGDNEGRALLDDLKQHATQEKYRTVPKYRPGDVVIWDSCSLLHATPTIDLPDPRLLWRVRVMEERATL